MSGLWLDFKFQQPEDQTKFCLPLNRDTEHLYYNTYLVIDAAVLTEPRVWQISKINRSNSKGVAVFTATQDLANQHSLKADYDADGNVIAWWADWDQNYLTPTSAVTDEEPIATVISKVTCSGKPQVRIGGSTKTFTVTFYDENGNIIDGYDAGNWSWAIDDVPLSNTLVNFSVEANKVKFKFLGDDSYIGKILTITNTSGDIRSSLDVELLAL